MLDPELKDENKGAHLSGRGPRRSGLHRRLVDRLVVGRRVETFGCSRLQKKSSFNKFVLADIVETCEG